MPASSASRPSARTRIVATVGPASSDAEILSRMVAAGVNVFRLNFSHGTHEEHTAMLATIRRVAKEKGRHIGILQDLCGPKMRLGVLPGDVIDCALGEEFVLDKEEQSSDPHHLTCSYADLPGDLNQGESVLFADGTVAMEVIESGPDSARLKVTLPGRLRSRQGINLPGSELNVPSLTSKDLDDLNWTREHADEIQFVGLSFVRRPEDVHALRRELEARNCSARIVVKIEKPQAVRHLEEIIAATDAVMIARGDLGVEMDIHKVPAIQKRVIQLCNLAHRPVITATQMLTSMEHSNRPTRAEASDVFNAVIDGTDAVMLSGESAIGEYPVETVSTMSEICSQAEAFIERSELFHGREEPSLEGLIQPITEAMVDAACTAAEHLDAPLIVAVTASGRTAQALSNRRPDARILALTPSEQTARVLSLCWGVTPRVSPHFASTDRALDEAIDWARQRELVHPGEYIVLLRGEKRTSRTVVIRQVN